MKTYFLLFTVTLFFLSCEKQKELTAQDIVDKTIEVSGGDKIKSATMAFDFRDKHYKATRNNGLFTLERTFTDSLNTIRDVLSNNGFERFINNEIVKVADSMIPRYSASVNSVHYFSVLPYGLNDAAVNKKYIEKVNVKGRPYHKIEITFNQEGGGVDFEDVFVYWVNAENYKTEYLAYSYHENHGIGLRFREAYNERFISGIRFVDYKNYKSKDTSVPVSDLDDLFENNKLELLSKIDLKNISVN
ncbi:DUF6503 family protein [Hwangdonia lutea]|uniref:DUF6503 family protein n=1 Tax=Hwangdonia lutea TaxID=3075823 RepID=A0AA97EME5_9FLAO|nr:DUF6503 family protein [Hwangdonia sp. SCSIO 19198]WOD43130.1 DUF6503 family protein [Hwangdonia sp. SCSIO 19198]